MAKENKAPDRLAQDAAAALAAGMSYGRYKAQQKMLPKDKLPDGWRLCKHCGKPFDPRHYTDKIYCDSYCSNLAGKERRYKTRAAQKKKEEDSADG